MSRRLGALQSRTLCQKVISTMLPAGPTSKEIFAKDPDRLLTEIVVRDEAYDDLIPLQSAGYSRQVALLQAQVVNLWGLFLG